MEQTLSIAYLLNQISYWHIKYPHMKAYFSFLILFISILNVNAQQIDERKIVETKWRYTYTLHVGSNTILHQADKNYDFFIHFKYDYTYEQFLNGKMTDGVWSLNGSDLFYQFKHISKFSIKEINNKKLVLGFTQPTSKGFYEYHFVKVSSADAPFIKPPNELPDVNVEADISRKQKRKHWWSIFSKKGDENDRQEEIVTSDKKKPLFISFELIGGGYYGGIDPVLRDYVQIKNTGRLIKEFKSVHKGLVVTKKYIPRDELEKFAEFVLAQKVFELNRMYDCSDSVCQKRKHTKPIPIPLRLVIAIGQRKKVITISIWGKDERGIQYVDYPPVLDEIISTIQKMANRLES